jgi:Flp pilus assembly protein TadG
MRRAPMQRSRAGSVMVEFTLSLMFLIPLFLGAWAFGFTFFQYAQLENAVRAGARYASTLPYDSATSTPSSSFLTAVQKVTVYGDPSADTSTATPVVAGLTTSNVQLGVTFANCAPTAVTVSITGFRVQSYLAKITLNGKPYVWFPYMGMFGPLIGTCS